MISDEITRTENLETIIKEMSTSALQVCSMLVAAEVIKSVKSDKIATVLMAAVEQLHESCTQDAVKELFEKE